MVAIGLGGFSLFFSSEEYSFSLETEDFLSVDSIVREGVYDMQYDIEGVVVKVKELNKGRM